MTDASLPDSAPASPTGRQDPASLPPVAPQPAAVPQPAPGSPTRGEQRPPLRRSTTDTVIAGVCGGLAEHTGVEALLWRVGFITLALLGPGIPVYLLLWLLVPAATAGPSGHDVPGRGGFTERLRKGMAPSR